MAIKKIPCGGFYYNDETVNFDDDVMTVVGGGSGLPDPSSLPDGTAMVAVNGEWKMQEGYGWTEEGSITTITWDGNTEGRDAIYVEAEGQRLEMNYKVSDLIFTKDSVLGGKVTMNGVDYVISDVVDNESDDYSSSTAQFTAIVVDALAVISCNAPGIIRATDLGPTIEYHCPTTGIYFLSFANLGEDTYVSSLTYGTPGTVHKIDEKYIPAQEKTRVIVTNVGNDEWEFDAETIPQTIDDYSNIEFIVYYLTPSMVGHDYVRAVIPCATCTYEDYGIDRISSIRGLPFNVDGSTIIVPTIGYSNDFHRYYGYVSEYTLPQDN